MFASDLLIYAAHAAFWAAFGVTRRLTRRRDATFARAEPGAQDARAPAVAPWSRAVLAVHFVAFAIMYFGLGAAVIGGRVPEWFFGQRVVGACLIGVGALLASWAVASFQSWRFRAEIDEDHELATEGAFRLLRHPIYMALNLLALGSAVWVPTATVWFGAALMLLGSELRARTEERLLRGVFGTRYEEYCSRTRRFIPGVY